MRRHLGTAQTQPYAVEWDLKWVPDQEEPIEVMARFVDETGLACLTPPVGDLTMERGSNSVHLYRPFQVPPGWQSRAGRGHSNRVFVPHHLDRALEAHLVYASWGGGIGHEMAVNRTTISTNAGGSYVVKPIDLKLLRQGTNILSTFSATEHHGIEIMWPGIVLVVRYENLPTPPWPPPNLVIFDDTLAAEWSIAMPEDASHQLAADLVGTVPNQALAIEPSSGLDWLFDLRTQGLIPTDGLAALRFSIKLSELAIRDWHRLELSGNDSAVVLMRRGQGLHGLDLEQRDWQTIEIGLDELGLRFPYLERLHFTGKLQGRLLLDNIRLVERAAATAIGAEPVSLPVQFRLGQSYPNPFNGNTVIRFVLAAREEVELAIYNLTGQKLVTLIEGTREMGAHTSAWDGRDADGRALASGVYFYRFKAGGQAQTRKLLLVQ